MSEKTDLLALEMAKRRAATVLTLVHRNRKSWSDHELVVLSETLATIVFSNSGFPTYLIIYGEYSDEDIRKVLGDAVPFTKSTVTGLDNPDLPFNLNF